MNSNHTHKTIFGYKFPPTSIPLLFYECPPPATPSPPPGVLEREIIYNQASIFIITIINFLNCLGALSNCISCKVDGKQTRSVYFYITMTKTMMLTFVLSEQKC